MKLIFKISTLLIAFNIALAITWLLEPTPRPVVKTRLIVVPCEVR